MTLLRWICLSAVEVKTVAPNTMPRSIHLCSFPDLFLPGCASHRTPDGYHGWDEPNYTHNLWPKPMTYQPGVLEAFTQ